MARNTMVELQEGNHIVEVRGLVKKFGFKTILRNVDLLLGSGDFLALFGHNGAGKTTLIHILSSLILPTSGTVRIAGFDSRYNREALRKVIGVISHHTFLYNSLTAFENLKFYGTMYEVTKLHDKIEEVLELVGLTEYMNDQVQTFSRGMQQRLSVARAIIHDPMVMFLDEPYTGLDQDGAQTLKQLLGEFRDRGKTIIMTSHNLERGLELCNQAAILTSGALVYKEDIAKIVQDDFKQTYLELSGREILPAQVSL
jgi:heme exporter protein A